MGVKEPQDQLWSQQTFKTTKLYTYMDTVLWCIMAYEELITVFIIWWCLGDMLNTVSQAYIQNK